MGLALDVPQKGEVPVQANGLDVLIAKEVEHLAEGCQLDYEASAYGEGFTLSGGGCRC